ncbi:hypothetical protein PEC301889_31070 [Pectobacterium carotovorum subsp. carotovorum]|nr:hypothetical protein PEC301889_31070 [Pectobacterium carotovorum subsp. carotovorum]
MTEGFLYGMALLLVFFTLVFIWSLYSYRKQHSTKNPSQHD